MSKPFPLRATARCVAFGFLLSASVAQAGVFDGLSRLFDDSDSSPSPVLSRTTAWLEHPERKLKWNDWDYVQLVQRESGSVANQHPAVIPVERVAAALARVRAFDGRVAEPVFMKDEIKHLAPAIAGALAKASPDQEIVFESTGPHDQYGPFTKKLTNTGRVFVADGKLNILFGAALRAETGNYHVDSLAHLPVGARSTAADGVRLSDLDAVEGRVTRSDWVLLSLDAPIAPPVAAQPAAVYVAPPANAAYVAPPAAPAARPATSAAAPAHPTVLPPPADATEDDRMQRLEKRLLFLKRLHEQGLLTDDEFKQKRADVVKQM